MRTTATRAVTAVGGAVVLALAFSACTPADTGSEDGGGTATLTVGGWGGKFTESTAEYLAAPYTSDTGIEVQFVDAPGEQVARLKAAAAAGTHEWDLVDSLDASSAAIAYRDGLAAEMPDDVRAELEELLPADRITDHGIYFSTLGFVIGCNTELAEACPTDAADYFDTENFPGPRAMIDRPLIALTFALEADGVDPATATDEDIDRAFDKLASIKDDVSVWYSAGDQMEQIVRDGQVSMGLLWSGRAYGLIDQGVPLEISWDGAVYDPGEWFVVAGTPNEDAAWEFLVALASNDQGQADWSTAMAYGPASLAALDLMDPAVAETLPDWPENLEKTVKPNYGYYAENVSELENRWIEFLG